jgi:hypothetical protein
MAERLDDLRRRAGAPAGVRTWSSTRSVYSDRGRLERHIEGPADGFVRCRRRRRHHHKIDPPGDGRRIDRCNRDRTTALGQERDVGVLVEPDRMVIVPWPRAVTWPLTLNTPTCAGAEKPTVVPLVTVSTTDTVSMPGLDRAAVTKFGVKATPSIVTVIVLFDAPDGPAGLSEPQPATSYANAQTIRSRFKDMPTPSQSLL